MTFSLSVRDHIYRARFDLKCGIPIIVKQGKDHRLMLSAELLTENALANLRKLGSLTLSITHWRAKTLQLAAYDKTITRISPRGDADLLWFHAMADPSMDLARPLKGPFEVIRDGNARSEELGTLLLKQAGLLPAMISVEIDTPPPDLTVLDLEEAYHCLREAPEVFVVSRARVPLSDAPDAQVHVYRCDDGSEHFSITLGDFAAQDPPPLVRLHSACFTGDVIGSLKCDCGPQLRGALQNIKTDGLGAILYLNQEGRGIGLANKMRAYSLQDLGFDTVEANHRLGFEDDERNFRVGAEMLKILGIHRLRLMTNNPDKMNGLMKYGLEVSERVPLMHGKTDHNAEYLAVKAKKSGHIYEV